MGIDRRQVRNALRDRTLARLHRGVYVLAEIELTDWDRIRAASLVLPQHSVVVDRSAAMCWGVDCFQYRELDQPPPLEWVTMRGRRASGRAEVHGRSRDLLADDWVEIDGVRVLTPLRTAMDLGCGLNRRDALATLDALMRAHGFSRQQMRRLLRRYAGRRGVVQLRELIELVDARAESPGESWTRLEILDHGLPTPELQWWVVVDGVPTYRLDLAYPKAKIAIEYDGEEFHSSAEARAGDETRRAFLRSEGWVVIVVGKHSFADEVLEQWIGALREALAAARTRPRRIYR
jgi:hypothetical protein